MTTLLSQAKSSQAPLGVIPLFGVAIDIATSNSEVAIQILPQIKVSLTFGLNSPTSDIPKGDLLNLYNTSILLSKSPVPCHITVSHTPG
jgi:hypothetical protein